MSRTTFAIRSLTISVMIAPFLAIDHIQLAMPAGAEKTARAFYAGLLGMTETSKPSELAKRGGALPATAPTPAGASALPCNTCGVASKCDSKNVAGSPTLRN